MINKDIKKAMEQHMTHGELRDLLTNVVEYYTFRQVISFTAFNKIIRILDHVKFKLQQGYRSKYGNREMDDEF